MDNIKDALLQMVKGARLANELDATFAAKGFDNTPYLKLYGYFFDAIYTLLGEDSETVQKSVTHTMLTAPFMEDERRAACLAHVFDVKFDQPRPNTISPESMRKMMESNGGYMPPEGDRS